MTMQRALLNGFAVGTILTILVAAVPYVATAASNGYCRYQGGILTCCTYYSNGNMGCQDYYWACDGNSQDENRRCYWHKRGDYYEPRGCLVVINPLTGETLILPLPEEANGVIYAATQPVNGDWDLEIPQPVAGYLPDEIPPALP